MTGRSSRNHRLLVFRITIVRHNYVNAAESERIIVEELFRTNNPVSVSFAQVLLSEQQIIHFVADTHMSIVDGSLGILPRRVMVESERLLEARRLMTEAGLGEELPENLVRPLDSSSFE